MNPTRLLFESTEDDFHPAPDRTEPVVWVRRLVIVERPERNIEPIQDVTLRRGLNVIATEIARPDDDGPVGHNVGKTLFTRLIRYCLGEPHFAKERVRIAIAAILPDGYVVAEVLVAGRCWTVARPIGVTKPSESWCVSGDDWRIALEAPTTALRFSEFVHEMESATVAQFAETQLPHEKRSVRWQDLLAWLSRDQYCRYRNPLEWRTSATESGTAELHDEDASILVRLVMDLLDDEERRLIHRHKELLADKSQSTSAVNSLQNDVSRTRLFLGQRLSINDDLLTADLFGSHARERAARSRRQLNRKLQSLTGTSGLDALASELNASRDAVTRIQQEVDTRQADRQVTEGELEQHRTASDEDLTASFADIGNPCPLPAGECPLKDTSQKPGERNPLRELLVAQKTAELQELDQTLAGLTQQLRARKAEYEEVKHRFEQLERRVASQRRTVGTRLWRADAMIREADAYLASLPTLQSAVGNLALIERQLEDSRQSQRIARDQIAHNLRLFNAHFNSVLRTLLGSMTGRVDISMRGIRLALNEQDSLPGEALATSGTVYSLDLACLRASIAGLGFMPRLLIHDSPREGDLESHIYAKLFSFAVGLEASFYGREPSFQYIVATTTPPPDSLPIDPYIRLRLDAREVDGLLLKRRF